MLWAAFNCAFFGFLRSSEFVAPYTNRFDPSTTLTAADVTWSAGYAHLKIKTSKTDPFRQGCIVRLSPTKTSLCPIAALTQFLPYHTDKSRPLFTFFDGTYLTRRRLSTILQQALPLASNQFSTHSFRIGAATTAASAGLPRWLIQQLGRWNSDCFRTYLRISNSQISNAANSLAKCNVTDTNVWDPDLC